MPIEQLMAMYYTNEESEKPQEKSEKSSLEEKKPKNEETDTRKVDEQASIDGQTNLDEDDPFQNQRITRGCK